MRKSPIRPCAVVIKLVLLAAAIHCVGSSAKANTADLVIVAGTNDLTSPVSYSAGSPSSTSDVVFFGNYNPATFTLGNTNTAINIGTLNDLSATALTVTGTGGNGPSTITLNGGTDSVAGTQTNDLIFVASGANLTLNNNANPNGQPLFISLSAGGNFDIIGTATIGASINDSSSGAGFNKSGAGTLTISGDSSGVTGPLGVNGGTLSLTGTIGSTVLNMGGGTFAYSAVGTNTETFTTTNINTGASIINNTVATDTLNLGTLSRTAGGTVDFVTTAGPIAVTSSGDGSGIIGPWAVVGTGNTLNYAFVNGSNVGVYSGGTPISTFAVGGGSSTTNLTIPASQALAGSVIGNTLQVLNTDTAATALTLGSSSLTLNGILNSGGTGESLTISGAGGVIIGGNNGNELDIIGNGDATTISSPIVNGGSPGSVVFTGYGTGVLSLTGTNTYTGITQVNGGTLTVGTGAASAPTAGVGLTILGGTVNDDSSSATVFGGASGTINLGGVASSSNVALIYEANASTPTLADPINVNAGNSGTITIEATTGNVVFSGAVTLANNLIVENTNATASNQITLSGNITGTGNLFLIHTSAGAITLSGANINFTGAIDDVSTSTATTTISGNLTGAESLLEDSTTGTISLSGANTNTGTTTVGAGTIEFTKETALYDDVTGNWNTSNIIVQGGGTLAFEVGNTGGFTSTDIATLNGLGSSAGGFENGSFLGIDTTGATTAYTGNGGVIANTNSGSNVIGLNKLGTNNLILEAAQTYTGPTLITAGTLQLGTGTAGQDASLASSSIGNAGTLLFEPSAGVVDSYNGSISGAGALTINGSGTGKVKLGGNDTFTGATTITSGTLDLTNANALAFSSLAAIPAAGALTFDSSAGNAFAIGSFAANANPNLVLQNTAGAAITLTVGNINNASSSTSGVLSGLGGLTTFGFTNSDGYTSTFTVASAMTYQGATTVLGGNFNLGNSGINGSIGTGGIATGGLVLGGSGGATFAYTRTGTVLQSFPTLTINEGENTITESTATQTLNLGTVSENIGGTVDFTPTGASAFNVNNSNVDGILGGWATYGGKANWAAVTSGSSVGAYTGYTVSSAATTAPGVLANVDFQATNTSAWTTQTINSLRFNQAAATTLNIAAGNVLSIASGGVLITPTATGGVTFTGGDLTGSPGGELVFNMGGTDSLVLNSQIEDNGSPTAVVVSGVNSTTSTTNDMVSFYNLNNSYSGGTYLNGEGAVNYTTLGTPFGTGLVIFGEQFDGDHAYGGLELSGAGSLTSGLLSQAIGDNKDNGEIGSNTGGSWTFVGAPGQVATFNGSFGTAAAGSRESAVVLDGGTEIFGALNNDQNGGFNGLNLFTVNGGTFQLGDGYSGGVTNETTGIALGGGTFVQLGNVAGLYNQAFTGGLTINSGASALTVNSNGGAGTVLSFGAVTRNAGGTVNFTLPSGVNGAQNATNGILTTTLNTNGILGGYATVNGTDWAYVNNPGTTTGYDAIGSTYPTGSDIIALPASMYTADTWASGDQTTVTTNDSPTSGSTTNSLRFNTAGANTVTLAGVNTITSGGILVTSNVSANTTTITGGTLEGGNTADLVIIQNNTGGGLTINSIIANNTGATGLTKSGPGLLTLSPSAADTFTGGIYLNGGILNTTSNGIGSAGSFTFNGGTLQAAGTISTSKAVTIGINGGTIDTNANSVTITGNVTKDGGNEFNGAGALGGFVATGVGSLTKNGAGTLSLQGAGDTFGGGLIINNGTVQDGNANTGTLGTGYVTFGASNTPTLDLDGNSAKVAGLIGSGANGVILDSAASTTSTLTLDGVYGETFGGSIQNGSGTVALTENLNNATETVTFLGANTYTGVTTITSGILQLGNGTTGNDGTISNTSGVTDNGTLEFDRYSAQSSGYAINGTGGVIVTGPGSQKLAASNAYSGPTTVNGGGTLLVTGSLTGTSMVNVGNGVQGATLGGTGLINGGTAGVTVANAATLSPGLGTAGLTIGANNTSTQLNLATGSTFALTLNNSNAGSFGTPALTDYSKLTLNTGVTTTLAGAITTSTGVVNGGDLFTIIVQNAGNVPVTRMFSNANSVLVSTDVYSFTSGGENWLINYDYNGGSGLTNSGISPSTFESEIGGNEVAILASVPEPSTWATMIGGLGMLIGIQRYRRRA